MNGIQFLTDNKGKGTAAVIDLKKHKELWEDIDAGGVPKLPTGSLETWVGRRKRLPHTWALTLRPR